MHLETAKPAAGKTQWPELVGKTGQEAVNIIRQETGNMRHDRRMHVFELFK